MTFVTLENGGERAHTPFACDGWVGHLKGIWFMDDVVLRDYDQRTRNEVRPASKSW
jgi:hypothetical protein